MSRPSLAARSMGWLVVLVLGAYSLSGPVPRDDEASSLRRLWGPFAGLAARVQWVRVHEAMLDGRPDLVWQRAETAIALDPGATDGYLLLARHLFFDHASLNRETEPERRVAWMEAAFGVAERGEAAARDPGALALWLGLARIRRAREEGLGTTAGERAGLLARAAEDFDRAAALGAEEAAELAQGARRSAELSSEH